MRRARWGWTLATMFIALLGACSGAAAQVATTTIQDTVYRADGTPASGAVVVSWPAFTTATGQAVAAGNTSVTLGSNGALSLVLTANVGATPDGSYYTAVLHLDDGTTSQQYWVVPVSGTPVTLAMIESQVLPTSVAMQTASRAFVQTAIAQAQLGGTTGTETFVPTTGGTMTGPLVLPGDPVTPTQAADKHYVDTNITAVLAGVGQKVSTVPVATQTVSQPAGTQLQVNTLNGELYANQFQTGDGDNGIANALASSNCGSDCFVVVDPSYTQGEPVVPSQIPNAGRVLDMRFGANMETFVNPVNPSGNSTAETLNQISTNSDANSPIAGSGVGSTRMTFSVSNTAMAGGSNQLPGDIENPPYGKANYGVSFETGSYFTAGQHVQNEHVINCFAVGDCLEGSWFLTSSGGYRDIADEGAHPFDLQVSEDNNAFQGTCSGGCTTGSTSLFVIATVKSGTQGEGRFLIDKSPSKTISTGQLASGGFTLTAVAGFTGTNFPVSVFMQTAAAATSQPKVLAPGTVTLPMVTSGAPAGFAVNTSQLPSQSGVACIADTNDLRFPNFETANYTVVDASHITFTLNKVHAARAVIAVGGLCGYGIEQTVDTVGPVRQVFPVVGATSATSILYAGADTPVLGDHDQSSTSGFQNITLQVASISRHGNVVTATLPGNMPVDVNGLTMTVSGVADASYNGSFQVTTVAANQLTYSDTGPDSTSTSGTISLLTGGYVLYPMAEVLSVYDASTKAVDGLLTLAPNTVTWAPGDAVEMPHYFQQLTAADTEAITQYVPRPIQFSSAGKIYVGQVGPGMRGWQIQNGVPASNYIGAGGTHALPDDAYVVSGVWKNDFEVDAGTNAVIRAHCNLNGCNRWDSGYPLFALDSAAGEDFLFYSPQSSTALWILGGKQFTFSPAGFSANAITTGTTGSVTTGAVTANSVSTSGTSLTLSQTGDSFGATSLSLENRFGLNGALFQNASLELVDFGFLDSASFQNNLRSTSGAVAGGFNNANGEFDFILDATSKGGAAGTNGLFLGINSSQFYPAGHGQVSINVPGGTNPNAALAVNGSMSVGTYAGTAAAPTNGLIVSGAVGIGSTNPVGMLSVGSTNQFKVDGTGDVTAQQIIGSGAVPTTSAGAGAGSGANATLTGSLISGVLSVTTGVSPSSSSTLATIGWTLPSATPPPGCSLMPRNAAAAAASGSVFTGAPSGSGWTVSVGATALAASTNYMWSYQCF
jgi:trimeric autotransporter adhesin